MPNATHQPDPLDLVAWPRATERLLIRRAQGTDAEAIWRYRCLAEVSHWVGWRPRDQQDLVKMLHQRLPRTLVIQYQGQVIGDLLLSVRNGWAQREVAEQARSVEAELGWVLEPSHGGHGIATEAVQELLRVCFEVLDVRRVTAEAFVLNESSWRLMERVGMRREFYASARSLHRDLGWVDSVGYALLATEWRAAHELPAGS